MEKQLVDKKDITTAHISQDSHPNTPSKDLMDRTSQVLSAIVAITVIIGFIAAWFNRKVKVIIMEFKETEKTLLESKLEKQKQNTREHIKNEIESIRKELGKDIDHVKALIEEKMISRKDEIKDVKIETLAAREAALTAQLQLSDAVARIDMISQRINSKGE